MTTKKDVGVQKRHLAEEELVALAELPLRAEVRLRLKRHVDACARCERRLNQMLGPSEGFPIALSKRGKAALAKRLLDEFTKRRAAAPRTRGVR